MAIFAKRHYEAIARAVQEADRELDANVAAPARGVMQRGMDALVKELVWTFRQDNDAFDQGRFERACKPGVDV